MLLSSILRILEGDQLQPETVAKIKNPSVAAFKETLDSADAALGLKKIEQQMAEAAGLLRPMTEGVNPVSAKLSGPSPEELLRAITEYQKQSRSRIVDVFE